jgi:hypothetical protein
MEEPARAEVKLPQKLPVRVPAHKHKNRTHQNQRSRSRDVSNVRE